MPKQSAANVVWGLVFIAISVIGGVVIGGITQHSLGFFIGGLAWAILGLVLLFQPATFRPTIIDREFHVFVTWSQLPKWAWVVVLILVVGGIVSMAAFRSTPFLV